MPFTPAEFMFFCFLLCIIQRILCLSLGCNHREATNGDIFTTELVYKRRIELHVT